VGVADRVQQDLGAVGGPGGHGHDVGLVDLAVAVAGDDDSGDRSAPIVGLQPGHLGAGEQGDVVAVEYRPHRDGLGVGLGVHQARVAVTGRAADADTLRPPGLVQQDAARRVEWVVAALGQVVGDVLDPGLVRDGGPRVGLAAVALGGVLAGVAV